MNQVVYNICEVLIIGMLCLGWPVMFCGTPDLQDAIVHRVMECPR